MADSSLILIAAFLMWTLFNILCHYFANLFLTTLLAGDQRDKYSPATAALALTVSQAAFCFVFTKNDCSHKSVPVRKTIYLILTLLHILATFTTNYSLSLVDISSTMAVKMAEPISTSFLHCIFLKRQLKVVEFTAVVLIVVGTIGFIYDPTSEYSDVKGAIFAFASNLLYALRNILLKSTGFNTSIKLRHLTEVSVYLILLSVGATLLADTRHGFTAMSIALMSAGSHVTYSYVSTSVLLRHVSVTSHAILNTSKRVLTVLIAAILGRRHFQTDNWLSLVICVLGQAIYLNNRIKISNQLKASGTCYKIWQVKPQSMLQVCTKKNRVTLF